MVDYENLYKFIDIARKLEKTKKKKLYIILPRFYQNIKDLGFNINIKQNRYHNNMIYFLDYLLERYLFFLDCVKLTFKVLYKFNLKKKKKYIFKIFCQGISSQEIFKYGSKSCFYFFVDNRRSKNQYYQVQQ